MASHYVDLHCHLDLYPDFVTAVEEAERAGVYTLTVTTTPKAWPRNREVTQGTRFVRAALGLHPQLVHERKDEISLWDQYLAEARYVGEVGIDAGPRYYHSLDLQKEVFEHVLQRCALEGNKVLSVHSVRSAKMVLDLIETHFSPSRGTIILHWFSGSLSEARRAAELRQQRQERFRRRFFQFPNEGKNLLRIFVAAHLSQLGDPFGFHVEFVAHHAAPQRIY